MTRNELIAALEKATGPNNNLDEMIFGVVNGWGYPLIGSAKYSFREIGKAYTASLDAALTLVPDRFRVAVMEWDHKRLREEGPWQCILTPTGKGDSIDGGFHSRCDHAPTPAIALCIAALKALEINDDGR